MKKNNKIKYYATDEVVINYLSELPNRFIGVPVKRHIIIPKIPNKKYPPTNTQNPTYRADTMLYFIATKHIMISVKYLNNFIIDSIISLVSCYKISNFYDIFNRKMRMV